MGMELSPWIVGLLGFILLFVLMFLRVPVAFAFGITGFLGLWYVRGLPAALGDLPLVAWSTSSDYVMICIPLFILMGNFANRSGIGPDLYKTSLTWFGRMRGGLALTTISGNAAFGAVTGASLAGLVTFTPIAWKPMLNLNYDKRLAAGCLMASGTLSQLIPPSLSFILYSVVTNESVGRLFIAGIFPGILQAIMYALLIFFLTKFHIQEGPAGPSSTWKEKIASLKGTWGMLLLFFLIIGGLYLGVFTPTEGAAIGAVGAFIILVLRKGWNLKLIKTAVLEGLVTSAMLFMITIGAMIFARFVSASNLSGWIVQSILGGAVLNPYIVLTAALVVFLIAGCVMPAIPMILLFTPLFYPIFITQYGMNPIWFGVIIVIMTELALVTPPVGFHLFVFKSLVKEDISTKELWQGNIPFVITDLIRLVIMVAFPVISVWLPERMFA
jgi:C4-dicarboxylate transporter DctM subunit